LTKESFRHKILTTGKNKSDKKADFGVAELKIAAIPAMDFI